MPSAWTISTPTPHPTKRIGGGGMRRRNIFPDPECAGMMHPYTNDGTRSDFVKNEGMMWMRATVTAVGTQQNYAQYSLNEDRVPVEGAYHVRLLAHAEGGDGMARCYARQPNFTYLPCYAVNIPDGQTIVVERAISVPAGCGELIVRICPAAVVGRDRDDEPDQRRSGRHIRSRFWGGGFRASSPRRPRRTDLEAGDRR